MSDTRSNTRHLVNVSEREVEAMRACDPDTLADLVSTVYRLHHNDDVREHACIIVASLLPGASSPLHAARAAVRIARRAVGASHALDGWDLYGDLTEEVVSDWRAVGVASHLTRYAPDPASAYSVTYGDLVATILAGQRTKVGEELRAACVAYVQHARTCERCTGADSHRVTVAGVRAHLDGRGAESSTYHAERRAVLRALARVGTFSDLARTIGDPAPMATPHPQHGRVSLGSIRKDSTRDQVAPVRTVWQPLDLLGYPAGLGYAPRSTTREIRRMSDAQTDALRATLERVARHAGEEYRGGSHAPVSAQADAFAHAPRADANTGSATTPGQALPSGAVPVSPRKRPRTGSTGPTTPAW